MNGGRLINRFVERLPAAPGVLMLLVCLVPLACASGQQAIDRDFMEPDTLFRLPRALAEISGLTVLPDGTLGAIQDESGSVFVLDPNTGGVLARHRFGGDGDFEAVEAVGDSLFVLRSDGRLSIVWIGSRESDSRWPARHLRTGLHRGCDAESLTFDRRTSSLWTACKERPGSDLRRVRAFYRLEEGDDRFSATLLFSSPGRSPEGSEFSLKRSEFKPSAMTFLPGGSLLVLSSVKPALLHMDREGNVLQTWELPRRRLPQPEGVALLPDGRLFVSSEGPGNRGTLAVYRLDLLR
jgi:uncharacterized protein YjiK